jgi:hypothetical protein
MRHSWPRAAIVVVVALGERVVDADLIRLTLLQSTTTTSSSPWTPGGAEGWRGSRRSPASSGGRSRTRSSPSKGSEVPKEFAALYK